MIVVGDNMTFYFFGVEIEAIVEPHNRQQPVPAPVKDYLDYWYEKIAKALRNRKGCGQRPLKAIAEPRRTQYRERRDRHHSWWITRDGSLIAPEWPRHPGGRSNLALQLNRTETRLTFGVQYLSRLCRRSWKRARRGRTKSMRSGAL